MQSKMIAVALLLLGGCGRPDSAQNLPEAPAAPAAPQAPEAPSAPSAPTAPSAPKVLSEPKGPIDPKSVEAAGQVVQHYGALVEQKRWTQSRQYWRDAATAQAFEKTFRTWKNVHLEIGDLGPAEGAAGSIYMAMPVTFYGDLNSGGPVRRGADIILRRVNDVPGSTAAQRRWHIERIEWRPAA